MITWVDSETSAEYDNRVQIDWDRTELPPHREHPGSPPRRDPEDEFVFKELLYTTAGGAVGSNGLFTASEGADGGKYSVLLFGRVTIGSRGVPTEFLEVKVVETSDWDVELVDLGNTIIGRKITSPASQGGYDRANLGTGYVFNELARYNPFIYDRSDFEALRIDSAPGPVIPVNLLVPRADDTDLVVVWYDDPELNDKILWPYQATLHTAKWPTTQDEGLSRIVLSSRFGSEGVDANGRDQEVVRADSPTAGLPREITFNPARFQELQVYSQPDPEFPGYNPNEEHGVIAPSFRFSTASPRPNAVYALRLGDPEQLRARPGHHGRSQHRIRSARPVRSVDQR